MSIHDGKPEPLDRKKERVLHTRVSADFEDELKRQATELGTSVSGLVRHALSHTIGALHQGMADAVGATEDVMRVGWVTPVRECQAADNPPQIVGWQELVLNLNGLCEQCNSILAKGTNAAIAVYAGSGQRKFLCTGCLEKLRNE